MLSYKNVFLLALICSTLPAKAEDFFANESYQISRRALFNQVYKDNRVTFYCHIPFDEKNNLSLPKDFDISKIATRVQRVEIEHLIPAEEFGNYIYQWWNGDKNCIDKNNIEFKGRKCAEKTSRIFRLMQADMYNLYPVIGATNAIRGNAHFTEFPPYLKSIYTTCQFKIADGQIEPPDHTKGVIARTYLYFEEQYDFFEIEPSHKKLFIKWNNKFPVSKWECERTHRIEQIQKNENKVTKTQCIKNGLWPGTIKEK